MPQPTSNQSQPY